MAGVNSSSMGRGGPVWPSKSSSQQQVRSPDTSEQVEGAHSQVSSEAAAKTTDISKLGQTESQQLAKTEQKPTQITQLSLAGIKKHLTEIGVLLSKSNVDGALLMAQFGVEISQENIELLNKLLKGKKSKNSMESAVLLLSKGLGESADDVGILNNLLGNDANIAKSLKQLSQMHSKMSDLLNSMLKDTKALQPFLSAFATFDEELKKLRKNNNPLFDKYGLINDSMAVLSFLEGLAKKLNVKSRFLDKYLKALGEFNKNLLGQIILSKDSIKQPIGALESFEYFQIPNPLASEAIIELLLRKQNRANKKSKKNKEADTNNQEKIIISMESENLGKITIILVVMGFRIWCTVHSDKESAVGHATSFREELVTNLEKYQYKLEDFKAVRKKVNIKKFIAPSQDLSDVKRIQTEI